MVKLELNLSEEDVKTLIDALERYVSDLGMEIADTDTIGLQRETKKPKNFYSQST